MPKDYTDIIAIQAGMRGGKPCIKGMRVTVDDVLEYLASVRSRGVGRLPLPHPRRHRGVPGLRR